MFTTVLVLATPFLFIQFPPLTAQTLSPTSKDYNIVHTQSIITKDMQLSSQMTQQPNMTLHPAETAGPTYLETSNTPVSESTAFETTATSVLETTALLSPETTASPFLETGPGPQTKTSATETHHTTGSMSTVSVPTSITTHGPPDFNISHSPNSSVSLDKDRYTTEVIAFTETYFTSVEPTTGTIPVTQGQSTVSLTSISEPTSTRLPVPVSLNGANWLWGIIIAFACTVCVGGVFIPLVCINLRKRKRCENFRSSLKNGGSYTSNKRRYQENDAWAGPVPDGRDKELDEDGEEEGKVEEKSKEADGEEVVLTTFTTEEEGKTETLRENLGKKEADSRAEEVPLLNGAKDGGEAVPPKDPLPSSLLPPDCIEDGYDEDGGHAFCLTTAV